MLIEIDHPVYPVIDGAVVHLQRGQHEVAEVTANLLIRSGAARPATAKPTKTKRKAQGEGDEA